MQGANSHRHLWIVLFWLFEALLVATVGAWICLDPRRHPVIDTATGITFLYSFVGLFIACFLLRRIARDLALTGWITLVAAFFVPLLFPEL